MRIVATAGADGDTWQEDRSGIITDALNDALVDEMDAEDVALAVSKVVLEH